MIFDTGEMTRRGMEGGHSKQLVHSVLLSITSVLLQYYSLMTAKILLSCL